ncbi:MAG: DNA primase [Saprospiraceae bacterium]
MITNKSIQEVLGIAKIEDVVGDFVNLRRRGVNMIGLCPFHDEKTPSFTVSPAKNLFKCFGCGKGGDPVRFIMEHEKLSFPESIKFLGEKYGVEIEETQQTHQEVEQRQLTDALYILNNFAKDHYVNNLFNHAQGKAIGLSYFKERGFRENIIKKFDLGFALESRDDLTTHALEKNFNLEHLKQVGLTSSGNQDFLRNRVIFTIHNLSGKIVAFAGRTLSADKKIPKYINSPETEIYSKRKVLYGLHFAKESIRKHDECLLVEGYTDVISLHQGDIQNVVATSGTALTDDQIRLIKRYTNNVLLIYDGDQAGINAALRGLDLVLHADMNVKLVLLPDGHDPDSYLSAIGSEKFMSYIKQHAEDFVLFKTNVLLTETKNDPIGKTRAIKDIVSTLAKISDPIKRMMYIKQCSEKFGISEQILNKETNGTIRDEIKKQNLKSSPPPTEINEDDWIASKTVLTKDDPILVQNDGYQEKAVVEVALNYGSKMYDMEKNISVAQYIIEEVRNILDLFDIPLHMLILKEIEEILASQGVFDVQYFIGHKNDDIRQFTITSLSEKYTYADWEAKGMYLQTQKMPDQNYINDCNNALLRLKFKKAKKIILKLEEYFKQANDNSRDSEEYLLNVKVYQELLLRRNAMAHQLGTVTF